MKKNDLFYSARRNYDTGEITLTEWAAKRVGIAKAFFISTNDGSVWQDNPHRVEKGLSRLQPTKRKALGALEKDLNYDLMRARTEVKSLELALNNITRLYKITD